MKLTKKQQLATEAKISNLRKKIASAIKDLREFEKLSQLKEKKKLTKHEKSFVKRKLIVENSRLKENMRSIARQMSENDRIINGG